MKRALGTVIAASCVFAPPGSARAAEAPDATEAAVTPPSLVTRVEAAYPKEALGARVEGTVGLDLVVAEDGSVAEATIVRAAGHGFDEAALAAARRFVFTPARRAGVPVRAVVSLDYEFRLPPRHIEPAAPTPGARAPSAARVTVEVEQADASQSSTVVASRAARAASTFVARDVELRLRPVGGAHDLLRATPGLVMVQHSGGGKAMQYFLRGFDVDHGTDFALSVDGVPVNVVTHAHGQGYADTAFLIPEVVEKLEVTKGPYFVEQEDFATAGAANFVTRDRFERASFGFGVSGSPGHGRPGLRALVAASPRLTRSLGATFAADLGRQNGPFDHANRWDTARLFNKLVLDLGSGAQLHVGEMSYSSTWDGSGQLPARAVERGLVSRFGAIAPDEGGYTSRHQLYVRAGRKTERSDVAALAYGGLYDFDLRSNFTLFARDPVNGDAIEQVDRRTFFGGRAHWTTSHDVGDARLATTVGVDARSDAIRGELWNTRARARLSEVRSSDVSETRLGAYAKGELAPLRWLRMDAGGRVDMLTFSVGDRLAASASDVGSAHRISPKANLVLSPLREAPAALDFFVNYGHGFHSNDVRGAFANPAVTPLTGAIGAEVGSRARLFDRWDLGAALWRLDLDSETVWLGDEGTTAVAGPTARSGLELRSRCAFTSWLWADADVSFSRSRFRDGTDRGAGIALAPKATWAGGVSARHELGPGQARGALRFHGVGDRPASDDGALVAEGFTLLDAHIGYALRRFDLAFDVENLLDTRARAAQFATTARLVNEPAIGAPLPSGFSCGSSGRVATDASGGFAGCEDVHFTPQLPLTLRVMATVFLD